MLTPPPASWLSPQSPFLPLRALSRSQGPDPQLCKGPAEVTAPDPAAAPGLCRWSGGPPRAPGGGLCPSPVPLFPECSLNTVCTASSRARRGSRVAPEGLSEQVTECRTCGWQQEPSGDPEAGGCPAPVGGLPAPVSRSPGPAPAKVPTPQGCRRGAGPLPGSRGPAEGPTAPPAASTPRPSAPMARRPPLHSSGRHQAIWCFWYEASFSSPSSC